MNEDCLPQTGLARAFENAEFAAYADSVLNNHSKEQEEEDQDIPASGYDTCASSNSSNKSFTWKFKKFGLR